MRAGVGRSWRLAAAVVVVSAAAVWACNGTSGSLTAGQACHSSSECAAGLVCDFGQSPAVCAGNLTPGEPDATPAPDSPPGTPDGAPMIDAPPGTPDAPPAPIDAAVPDAPLPDAPLPDAPLPDATI